MDNMVNGIKELSNEELSRVSGGGGEDDIVFQFEYEPYIEVYYLLSLGEYLMKDTLTGIAMYAKTAGDLEDAACELKKLR